MKNNSSKKNAKAKAVASPAPAAPAIVLPEGFAPLPGMNEITVKAAVDIAAKHPSIVKAAVEFREAYGRAGEKFFGIASTLREAKLVKKEATMLLHALGFSASRTSEMIKLSSVSDEIWSKYSAQSVGFRAALQLQNESGDESSTGGKPDKKPKAKHKVHPIMKEVAEALADILNDSSVPMLDGKRTEYGHTIELPEGRFIYVSLFSDKE